MSNLCDDIENAISLCLGELEKNDAFPYLNVIIETLKKMRTVVLTGEMNVDQRARMAGALGRIITEDYTFSSSKLGLLLLGLANRFAPNDCKGGIL